MEESEGRGVRGWREDGWGVEGAVEESEGRGVRGWSKNVWGKGRGQPTVTGVEITFIGFPESSLH